MMFNFWLSYWKQKKEFQFDQKEYNSWLQEILVDSEFKNFRSLRAKTEWVRNSGH